MEKGTQLRLLTARNIKLYFKDKMVFFTSLLSPIILLVLFMTFLRGVYESSFTSMLPEGMTVESSVLNAFTGGWLISSILGVSSVTIAFCSNIIMAQDKVNGSIQDLLVTPVRRGKLALSYYLANLVTTMLVCLFAMAAGLIYLACVGWYLSVSDVLMVLLDTMLCILFGTSLAALVERFISTQGGISAVATLVSSMYGFVCGAYMPISQFSEPIRNFVSFIPGTYGVVLLRRHLMNGSLATLDGRLPDELVSAIRDGFDGNIYFFGHLVEVWQMYAILGVSSAILLGIYVLLSVCSRKKQA